MNWPLDLVDAAIVFPKEILVLGPPLWQFWRQIPRPHIDRADNEVVGQHSSAQDSFVVVAKPRGCEVDAGADAVPKVILEKADFASVVMPLEIAADLVVVVLGARGQQETGGFHCSAGEDNPIGGYFVGASLIEKADSRWFAIGSPQNLGDLASGEQG